MSRLPKLRGRRIRRSVKSEVRSRHRPRTNREIAEALAERAILHAGDGEDWREDAASYVRGQSRQLRLRPDDERNVMIQAIEMIYEYPEPE